MSPDDLEVLTSILSYLRKLDRPNQERILAAVAAFLGIPLTAPAPLRLSTIEQPTPIGPDSFSADRSISPKDFLLDKQPSSDVEKVACLSYYLTHYKGMPHFETVDISKLNTEAAQMKFSNAAYAVNNAMQSGYLVPAPQGKKQLSAAGERFVQALPDRQAAKAAMAKARPRRASKKTPTPEAKD